MALGAGSESPSAAFLAGAQHGAQLAVQHHAAVPSVALGAKAPGAQDPKGDRSRRPATAVQQPAAPQSYDDLMAAARKLAGSDIAEQVNAIKAQQQLLQDQALQRAQQIQLASQAGAQFLTGIGDKTAQSYSDAAQQLAGLAGGFSGDLKTNATNAANDVAHNLSVIGAPTGPGQGVIGTTQAQVAAQPTNLANILYNQGGFAPANLLQTSGQAFAAAQRQLPASTLAYGDQEAQGTLGQGATQAATLTPDILAAIAKLPAATQSYFNQKLALAKYNTGVDEFNAKTGIQVGQFNTRTALATQRLNLDAQKYATSTLNSDRSYALALDSLGVRKASEQRAALKDEYKLANGGYTPTQIGKLSGDAAAIASDAFSGFTDPKTNKEYKALNFGQALTEMRKGTGNGAVPLSLALKALKQVGYDVPSRYDKLMGGPGQVATPFGDRALQGRVSIAPGANRSGVSINPAVTAFVAQVAGIYGKPLTIGTGTNHNKDVLGTTRQSDHWDGNAADIPATGAELTRLGQDALIAAGMPEAEARKQTGGLFNVGNKQIIFNSMEGGNHYNHLHVGVR